MLPSSCCVGLYAEDLYMEHPFYHDKFVYITESADFLSFDGMLMQLMKQLLGCLAVISQFMISLLFYF